MERRLKRLIAMLLFSCIVAGSIPAEVVYAKEADSVTNEAEAEESNADVQDDSIVSDTVPDNTENVEGSNSSEPENSETAEPEEPAEDTAVTEDETEKTEETQESVQEKTDAQIENEKQKDDQVQENGSIEKNTNEINYVIVESPYLETPGTERIAVSYGDGSETVSDITLTVRNDEGQDSVWDLSVSADQLYLFSNEFTDESESGTYEVISLNVTDDEGEKNILFSDFEMEAYFGVNEEYSGIEELQPLDTEAAKSRSADEAAGVEATVAEIDPENVEESAEQIVDALENAEEQTAGVSTYSADVSGFAAAVGAQAKTAAETKSKNGNVVVALDPGHDSTHAGASYNGLKEEVLTLKIAQYCKAELEKYSGVTVYMTRTGASCPHPGGSSGSDIGDRVYAAADAGADIYVSIHLNSSTSSSANGAEVIIPNKSWKPELAKEGEKLAEAILKELEDIGLNMRPDEIYSKDTTINERYPDGSISDYFSVQIYAKERGIPGIIVEHAFLTNSGDRTYLSSESGLKKLGVADATGIAEYLGLKKIGEKVSVPEGTYVLESALGSGKVATVTGGSRDNGAKLTLNDNSDSSAQRFEITSRGDGYYTIIAEHSGKALDIRSGSTANGTIIQQYSIADVPAQKWSFIDAGDGYYYLYSALDTVMDVKSGQTANGTQIQSYKYNGTKAQKWKLVKSDYQPVEDGTYTISSSLNKNIVLDVENGLTTDKANIKLSSFSDLSSQRYEISYVGDGYYSIRAEHSSKALDVVSGNKNNGTNIQQYTWKNVSAQLWKFVDAGNGSFFIKSKCGTVMTIEGEKAAPDSNVYTWAMDFGDDQKWILNKSDYQPVADGKYVISSYKALGKVATEKNGNLQLEEFINNSTQKYEITYVGDGYYKIILEKDGKAIDVEDASNEIKTNVQLYKWNGTPAQLWKFIPAGDGSYYIKSKLGTTMELASGKTDAGTNIQMYSMNWSEAQKWILDEDDANLNEADIAEGTYTIKNATNTSQVLDVKSGSTSKGANIQTYKSNGTSAQHFEISSAGNGYYRIQAEHSSRVIDVADGSFEAGANVQQYNWNGTDAQLWKFIDAGNGKYYIQSKKGTVLDLNASVAASGVNVETDTLKGEESQKWILEKTEYRPVEDGTYVISSYKADGKVVSEDSGTIQIEGFVNEDDQKYKVSYVGEGYYKIIQKKTGKSITVKDGSDKAKIPVQLTEWKGTDAQLWKFASAGSGSYYIKSKLGTTLELTSGKTTVGTSLQMYSVNGTEAQRWIMDEEKAALKDVDIEEGTYTIRSSTGTSQVVDVKSGSTSKGANIQTYKSNGTSAQHFEISSAGNGYYRIQAEHSSRVIDVSDGSFEAGANVQQYNWNGTDAQLWKFIDAGNGKYYIQSKKGTVLDLNASVAASGVNVETDTLKGEQSQKWILEKTEYRPVEDGTYVISSYKVDGKVVSENNGTIQIEGFVNEDDQKYKVSYVGEGYYKIIQKKTGKSITVKDGSDKAKTPVQLTEWKGTDAQLWKFASAGSGSYYIKSKLGTTLELTSGKTTVGTSLQMYSVNGTEAQRWIMDEEKAALKDVDIEEGTYTIRNSTGTSQVLDVKSGSKSSGAKLQTYKWNNTSAQHFIISPAGNNYYRITAEHSGMVLDVEDGSFEADAKIQQYKWNGTDAQLWKFVDAGNNNFFIISKKGTVVDLNAASAVSGSEVQTGILDGTAAQKWQLEYISERYPIMGTSGTSVEQMASYFKSKNSNYPYKDSDVPTIEDFCKIYIEECKVEGVKAEVAFCQAMLETGFLKFGGDVDKSQYNFAGLGATGNGAKGESFPTIRTGIRAQVQHLKAYASTEPLNQECVDTRFKYVTRGCAPYVQWLGIQENPEGLGWAASKNYGKNIVDLYITPLKLF